MHNLDQNSPLAFYAQNGTLRTLPEFTVQTVCDMNGSVMHADQLKRPNGPSTAAARPETADLIGPKTRSALATAHTPHTP